MKETNAQKISRYYNISRINKKYQDIVERHINGLLSDAEFIFECDKIYNRSWRKDFTTLQNVRDEIKEKN